MAYPTDDAWRIVPDGIEVAVRLTPRGGRDALDGVEALADGSRVLRARVRAAASEGEANAALLRLLADALAVSTRQVTLIAGAKARRKRLRIAGDGADLAARLERLVGGR